ncbi:MAG: hypothetical protein A2V85_04350 [Chloroflexi bacterium RBG_16_72_14]|nr:MAG: hypothetical protein A2V85_04350 [Chloroflexi bacterium RBG_16_72_14]
MSRQLTIAVAGVTGRMGSARHLREALVPLAAEGLRPPDGTEPVRLRLVLVGRDASVLERLAATCGAGWTTDLDAVLADPGVDVYFDARRPDVRPAAVSVALEAGKHVYVEKPLALEAAEAEALAKLSRERGLRTGIVHDKLFTPGYIALRRLLAAGTLGAVVDVRGAFGYWVHDGTDRPAQRPSWNFRREAGGSLIPDLFTHWSYLLELVGRPVAVAALTATHVAERRDERGNAYPVTVEDVAHVLLRLDNGATASVSSSWVERPFTPFTLVVHGLRATAHVTPAGCWITEEAMGDGAPWSDGPVGVWRSVPSPPGYEFRAQWLAFLRHVAFDEPFPWTFASAVRAARLCAAIEASAAVGAWSEVPGDSAPPIHA